MRGDQSRRTLVADEVLQRPENQLAGRRIEIARRLVGKDHLRMIGGRTGDRHTLLLATRELGRPVRRPWRHAENLEQLAASLVGDALPFADLIEALAASPGLDEKTKHLIYIALNAASGSPGAAVAHVGFAKKLGASREAIRDAILMTLTVSGLKGVTSCLPEALAAYDR